jgi:large subunit ribosomal protein L13
MKTFTAKPELIKREWRLIDAQDKVLGRLASEIANYLRGKHKPEYTPHADTGDFVVVVNAGKIQVTGNKMQDKIYYRYTGFPGGIKEITLGKLLDKQPTAVLKKAVKGMLPKGPLGRQMFKKLKVYATPTHPHQAQLQEASTNII